MPNTCAPACKGWLPNSCCVTALQLPTPGSLQRGTACRTDTLLPSVRPSVQGFACHQLLYHCSAAAETLKPPTGHSMPNWSPAAHWYTPACKGCCWKKAEGDKGAGMSKLKRTGPPARVSGGNPDSLRGARGRQDLHIVNGRFSCLASCLKGNEPCAAGCFDAIFGHLLPHGLSFQCCSQD